MKEYRAQNPEAEKLAARKHYARNGDTIRTKAREYYWKNIDAVKARQKKYRQENREKIRQEKSRWAKKFFSEHREEVRKRNQAYVKNNPHMIAAKKSRRRALLEKSDGKFTGRQLELIKATYGHRCARCRRAGIKLTVDHVVALKRGGRNDISNIQPLCESCNKSKQDRPGDYRLVLSTGSML